jgi:hypothetical protein
MPGFVRVVELHRLKSIEGLRAEILLVHNAIMADDEGPSQPTQRRTPGFGMPTT